MSRKIFFIALLAPAFCLAQQPSTQPAVRYDPGYRSVFGGIAAEARITLAPGVPPPSTEQLRQALGYMSAAVLNGATRASFMIQSRSPELESERAMRIQYALQVGANPQYLFPETWQQAMREPAPPPTQGAGGRGRGRFGVSSGINQKFQELVWPQIVKLNEELIQQFQTFVRSDANLSPEDRAQRVAQLISKIEAIEKQSQAMQTLAAAQPDAAKRLAEKVQQLYGQQQGLQMQLGALQARRQAIQMGLQELQQQAQVQRQNDQVVEEMQKIVRLHEQRLAQIRAQAASGVTSQTQAAEAEAELAEARLRLLERQAAIGKGGKGELMDRLTDELAMVSINTTDLEIQLKMLQNEIEKTDPAKLTEQGLQDLLRREPALDPAVSGGNVPPLYNQLQQQLGDLRLEWLKLVVDDVEIVEENGVPANDL